MAATSQYEAMRPPNVPYGYPSNLNQYQPYDAATAAAYSQYAAAYHHSKDQMITHPYVSVYQMGYPVILPGNNSDAAGNNHNHRNNEQKQEHQEDEGVKKEGDHNDNTNNNNDDEIKKEEDGKQQQQQSNSSPVPSTSTSPATTSSPESNEDDDATKLQNLQRLTELCTAALTHNNNHNQSRAD